MGRRKKGEEAGRPSNSGPLVHHIGRGSKHKPIGKGELCVRTVGQNTSNIHLKIIYSTCADSEVLASST